MRLTTSLQRGGILCWIVKMDNYDLDVRVEDIAKVLYLLAPHTIRRRLNDLEKAGFIRREWQWSWPCTRWSLTDSFDKRVQRELEQIILEAGRNGITQDDAMEQLLRRVIDIGEAV